MKFLNYLNEENIASISGLTNRNPICIVYKNPSSKELVLATKPLAPSPYGIGDLSPKAIRYIGIPKTADLYVWNANIQIHDYAAKELKLIEFPNDAFWGNAEIKAGKIVPENDLTCGKNIIKSDFKKFSHYFANIKELEKQYNPKWLVHS